MIPAQLGQAASVPGVVGALLVLVGAVIIIRFVVGLAIRVALIGLVLFGAALVLEKVLGLGLPIVGGLVIAG